jgi:hypothetical protein
MPIELFGFTIGKTQKDKEARDKASFALPPSEDGSLDVYGGVLLEPMVHILIWKGQPRMT